MDVLEREGIANAAAVGSKMIERLRSWIDRYAIVGDVRGRGLMIGVELVKNKEKQEPASNLRDHVVQLAFERGLLILGCGESNLRLCPPLIVNQHEADIALNILEDCVELAARS
jgi:4-aminobutyrate aminotransferase